MAIDTQSSVTDYAGFPPPVLRSFCQDLPRYFFILFNMNNPETHHIDFSLSLESAAPKVPANNLDTTDLDEILTSPDEMADAEDIDRKTAITNFVMEHDHFDLDTRQANITLWLLEMLATIEDAKRQFVPEFDITSVDPELLRPMVQQWRANYEELAIKTENLRREELLQAYMTAYAGQATSEIFVALSNKQELPETIQLKAAAYAQMFSPVVIKSISDRTRIVRKIDQYTVTNAPTPYWFVLSEIMTDESLSEKTKTAIAKEFSLDPDTISGASLMKALTEMDAEDQENVTRENKPVPLGDGLEAFLNLDGSLAVVIENEGEEITINFALDDSPKEIGMTLSLLKLWKNNGQDELFGVEISPHSGLMKGVNRVELYRLQRLFEACIGGNKGYSGEILTDDLIQEISNISTFIAHGHNADELELFVGDTNYAVKIKRLAAVSLYIRERTDQENIDINILRTHLALIFPESEKETKELEENFNESDIIDNKEAKPV